MKYFPMKPAVGGIPVSESRKMSIRTAGPGARCITGVTLPADSGYLAR